VQTLKKPCVARLQQRLSRNRGKKKVQIGSCAGYLQLAANALSLPEHVSAMIHRASL
jgi:hypothetical protein